MTLTTTRWNSPAILTCSSRQRAARCCRWGQRGMRRANHRAQSSPLSTPGPLLTHTSNPPSPAWPGRGQISFSLSWDRAGSDAWGCFQSVSLCHRGCHWLAAAKAPAGSFYPGLTLLWTARGMCCVLFLCVALMGCHGGSCVPQEQSWERRQTRPSISPAVKGSVL